eukprot:TRINITY_DN15466_c0_g1_i2.p1 TRINITY_DN15466_c0_g1~~TRINITY_DN15466_c0_g1_i2.p1  ORF type:complete len:277 (+),score=33.27 TRINITY_DN15466_c0_g1_i2:393-1223(+)
MLLDMCAEERVHTRPTVIGVGVEGAGGVLVVPLLSWHHQSFDTEPDITNWEGIPRCEDSMMDYHRCAWPDGMDPSTEQVAAAIDNLNSPPDEVLALREPENSDLALVSFSHFVPRIELVPEKRFLFLPTLNKAVGSRFLGERVDRLGSNLHVFGHTHFGWDQTIGKTRFVQAALGYPSEWVQRPASMKVGELPESPMLIWDSETGFAPESQGRWSDYYLQHERTPEVTNALAPWVAPMYCRLEGGEVCESPMGGPKHFHHAHQAPAPEDNSLEYYE